MIKAIFFDFDGVLTNFECGSSTVCHDLSERTGIPEDALLACYDKHARDLYVGNGSYKGIWNDFCECVGRKIDISLLGYAFRNTPMNEKMLALAGKLRKNYMVGIITDNTKERFGAIIDEFKLLEKFDTIILSADIGATKKEEVIFKAALDSLKVKPEECVFIDNSSRNLEIPKRVGFKTLFYDFEKKDFDGLVASLKSVGLKI